MYACDTCDVAATDTGGNAANGTSQLRFAHVSGPDDGVMSSCAAAMHSCHTRWSLKLAAQKESTGTAPMDTSIQNLVGGRTRGFAMLDVMSTRCPAMSMFRTAESSAQCGMPPDGGAGENDEEAVLMLGSLSHMSTCDRNSAINPRLQASFRALYTRPALAHSTSPHAGPRRADRACRLKCRALAASALVEAARGEHSAWRGKTCRPPPPEEASRPSSALKVRVNVIVIREGSSSSCVNTERALLPVPAAGARLKWDAGDALGEEGNGGSRSSVCENETSASQLLSTRTRPAPALSPLGMVAAPAWPPRTCVRQFAAYSAYESSTRFKNAWLTLMFRGFVASKRMSMSAGRESRSGNGTALRRHPAKGTRDNPNSPCMRSPAAVAAVTAAKSSSLMERARRSAESSTRVMGKESALAILLLVSFAAATAGLPDGVDSAVLSPCRGGVMLDATIPLMLSSASKSDSASTSLMRDSSSDPRLRCDVAFTPAPRLQCQCR